MRLKELDDSSRQVIRGCNSQVIEFQQDVDSLGTLGGICMAISIGIGDWVRHADASIAITGQVVAVREAPYVIVEWQKGLRGAHRIRSLKLVMHRLAADSPSSHERVSISRSGDPEDKSLPG